MWLWFAFYIYNEATHTYRWRYNTKLSNDSATLSSYLLLFATQVSFNFRATVTFHFSTQPSFHVFKTLQLAQIKLRFDRKIFFPCHTICFLPILPLFSPVWHMAASFRLTADVTSLQLISTLYPPHLSDSPASLSPTHSFFLSASAHTAILIWKTRSERHTEVERGNDKEKGSREDLSRKRKRDAGFQCCETELSQSCCCVIVIKKALAVWLPSWLCFKSLFSNQEPCDFLHEVTPLLLQKAVSERCESDREGGREGERGRGGESEMRKAEMGGRG